MRAIYEGVRRASSEFAVVQSRDQLMVFTSACSLEDATEHAERMWHAGLEGELWPVTEIERPERISKSNLMGLIERALGRPNAVTQDCYEMTGPRVQCSTQQVSITSEASATREVPEDHSETGSIDPFEIEMEIERELDMH